MWNYHVQLPQLSFDAVDFAWSEQLCLRANLTNHCGVKAVLNESIALLGSLWMSHPACACPLSVLQSLPA